MLIEWQKIIDETGLFWQYPVITEKAFFNQNKTFSNYLAFPWATLLDKNVNLEQVKKIILQFTNSEIDYYTCCQHIRFRELISLFKDLNIKTVYTPHKCINEDTISGIAIKPCPLYAVNFEDTEKNSKFHGCDFINKEREYLYSFVGGLQPGYLTDIRERIFKLPKSDKTYLKNTGGWHFNEIVYSNKQNNKSDYSESNTHKNNTEQYNSILLNSRYSLCPSGTGPNSIRFWESLASGAIPILLSDTLELPQHHLWDEAIITIKEKNLEKINDILAKIDLQEENERRKNCLIIYNHFKNNYSNEEKQTIVHYCCGSYYRGNFGGVACYDYQFSKVFPHRVFFEGPKERQKMLQFLDTCRDPIVVTDNHLSCDIPNKYKTFVVHHGSALTHAIREPTWDPYWKQLCCDGQDKMLYHRFVDTTKFISTSKFCTDEFTKHYEEDYKKFERIEILHCSEFNEQLVKKEWNQSPIVLGNWSTENKGKLIIEKFNKMKTGFSFKSLNVFPQGNIKEFISKKQKEYLTSDIFLQISLSEGNSYATLDALLCGLPIVASNVGLFYKDVPNDCFVSLDWNRNNEEEYVLEKINYAWENKDILSHNARQWYIKNYSFDIWKQHMKKVIK